jgi:hypothetical protein
MSDESKFPRASKKSKVSLFVFIMLSLLAVFLYTSYIAGKKLN